MQQNAEERFKAIRFLGNGCDSFVYSVSSKQHFDRGQIYAMKRFYLRSPWPLLFAQNELRILKKIAADPEASRFLPTLYYSLVIHNSPVLVLTKALNLTLSRLVKTVGELTLKEAKFYLCEMISGLRYLHSLGIVHMELKNNNVLIRESGHIMITDFDRSYDRSACSRSLIRVIFNVNINYAAPEIANRVEITPKADVWSLGVLTSFLIGKFIRQECAGANEEREAARLGRWHMEGFQAMPENWREFFTRVFTIPPLDRPSIEDLQNLPLFEGVDWNCVKELQVKPPFTHRELKYIASQIQHDFNPKDPAMLNYLFSYCMPKISGSKVQWNFDENGNRRFLVIPPNTRGLAVDQMNSILSEFHYIHPLLNYGRLLTR